jgi:hypothetical protein
MGRFAGMGTTSKLRLLYLPVRARVENIRMMLAYGGIKYEDVVIPFDAFAKLKKQVSDLC